MLGSSRTLRAALLTAVVALVVTGAAAASSKIVYYFGPTSQAVSPFCKAVTCKPDQLRLGVRAHKVILVSYNANYTGSAGCSNFDGPPGGEAGGYRDGFASGGLKISHSKFSGTMKSGPRDVLKINGQFFPKHVDGTFSEVYKTTHGTQHLTCKTGKVTFSAAEG